MNDFDPSYWASQEEFERFRALDIQRIEAIRLMRKRFNSQLVTPRFFNSSPFDPNYKGFQQYAREAERKEGNRSVRTNNIVLS